MYFSAIKPSMMAGAGGWCAQAFFLHGFAQLVVFHRFAGTFHGAQERGFRVAGRGFGFEALGVDRVTFDLFIGCTGTRFWPLSPSLASATSSAASLP
jgi:hypothetical protein